MAVTDPFISSSDLSEYLERDLDEDKALIAVDSACDIVRGYMEIPVNVQEDEEITIDGSGTDALVLPSRPVVEVSSVALEGDALVADEDYKVDLEKGMIYLLGSCRGWRRGRLNYEVTYSHGWEPDDIPRRIRMVALNVAARIYDQGIVQQESVGGYQVVYGTGDAVGLSANEMRILDKV